MQTGGLTACVQSGAPGLLAVYAALMTSTAGSVVNVHKIVGGQVVVSACLRSIMQAHCLWPHACLASS